MKYFNHEDIVCPFCGEEVVCEFNDSHTSFVNRYVAYCGCPKKDILAISYKSSYVPPTIGDLLRSKRGNKT